MLPSYTLVSSSAKSRLALEEASAALRSGHPADAERTLRKRIFEQPDDVAAMAKLGDILAEQRRDLEASILYKRALAIAPEAHHLRFALAQLLQRQGQFQSALDELEAMDEPSRSSFPALCLKAALLGLLGQNADEIEIYQRLVAGVQDNPALWMNLGNALKTVGRIEEARGAFRKSIKSRPTFGEAYWSLANLKTVSFEDREIASMRKALRGKLQPDDALHFHFALGKALEDRGQLEESFRHYTAGNAIRASQFPPALLSLSSRVDEALKTFDKLLLEKLSGQGSPSSAPIFVVGVQRSGSTLIEQILASHPAIEGTTELTILEQLFHRLAMHPGANGNSFAAMALLEPEELAALGEEYVERARSFRQSGKPHFIDKLPANWLNVGLIRAALPNAKIIDARRHPMACGFSNFKQHYATGIAFSYSQESIGHFYRDYLRLMRHFDTIDPGSVHLVINERMIDDPEGEIRRMLEYLGLPFDPACLEFHRNRRAVRTPSAEQVRRPINRDGVDQWRQYEPWLGPLKEALGDALDTWDKPASEL